MKTEKNTIIKLLLTISFLAFLAINNFYCLFYKTLSIRACLYTGFGAPDPIFYYMLEIFFSIVPIFIVWYWGIFSRYFIWYYYIYSLMILIFYTFPRFKANQFSEWDLVYVYYIIVLFLYSFKLWRKINYYPGNGLM